MAWIRLAAEARAEAASPSFRTTLPGVVRRASNCLRIPALSSFAAGPSSHCTFKACRPEKADQVSSAKTATPLDTGSTFFTPGTLRAAEASKDFSLPPNTGQRSMLATSMPGSRRSEANWARPVTKSGPSTRGISLPRIRKSLADFRGGSAGGVSLAARSTRSP